MKSPLLTTVTLEHPLITQKVPQNAFNRRITKRKLLCNLKVQVSFPMCVLRHKSPVSRRVFGTRCIIRRHQVFLFSVPSRYCSLDGAGMCFLVLQLSARVSNRLLTPSGQNKAPIGPFSSAVRLLPDSRTLPFVSALPVAFIGRIVIVPNADRWLVLPVGGSWFAFNYTRL